MSSLRRSMSLQIALMIVGLVMIGLAGLWGVRGLTHDYSSAMAGYQELREIYEISSHVNTARTLVTLSPHGDVHAINEINQALRLLELYSAPDPTDRTTQHREKIRSALVTASAELKLAAANRGAWKPDQQTALFDPVLAEVNKLSAEERQAIAQKQLNADRKLRATMIALGVLSAVVVLVAVVLGIVQYRSVTRPLIGLSESVRRIAQGNFSERAAPQGHAEFVALAHDFNRMADELDSFYRELERKVAEKSRELVRSERLASVGYLAAGVAHEINNPIGIIAGHAELSLQNLRTGSTAAGDEAAKSLAVIAEEAFRCKQIVEKLLTLARPGSETRSALSLGEVARSVASTVAGLGQYKEKKVLVSVDDRNDLTVIASEGEMKQVVLNLTLNALDALDGTGGEVRIEVGRDQQTVELKVSDSGRGMTPQVLEHVFEPFFTSKRGSHAPGTGLGLSITHAIVAAHEGTIGAESAGPGKGSTFTVRLPAAKA